MKRNKLRQFLMIVSAQKAALLIEKAVLKVAVQPGKTTSAKSRAGCSS